MVSGSSCHPSQTSQPLSISYHKMLGWADVPSGRHPPGGPPSPGLTSADEPLIVYSLLAHTTVLPLLERLQPEGVGVDGFKLFRLQWKRNKGYYRDMIRTILLHTTTAGWSKKEKEKFLDQSKEPSFQTNSQWSRMQEFKYSKHFK